MEAPEIPQSDVIMVSMTAAEAELVAWLLGGDPSIRWRVHRRHRRQPTLRVLRVLDWWSATR